MISIKKYLPRFSVLCDQTNQSSLKINFKTLQDCDIEELEFYFKHLCSFFCDVPHFCFDEDSLSIEITSSSKDIGELKNLSIFLNLMQQFYHVSSKDKLIDQLNHYRCINKIKIKKHATIFQKTDRGFIIRYLLNSLFYDSETHWIVKQNDVLVKKISFSPNDKSLIHQFHQLEQLLNFDLQPQIILTCAMISDFVEEAKQLLRLINSDSNLIPFWNMFFINSPNSPTSTSDSSQLLQMMEVEDKLTTLGNKNIQWWVLLDHSLGVGDKFDFPQFHLMSLFESPNEFIINNIESYIESNKNKLFMGINDNQPTVAMLLTFAHYQDFFETSPLSLDLGSSTILKTIWKRVDKLFKTFNDNQRLSEPQQFQRTDDFETTFFIQEAIHKKIMNPLTIIQPFKSRQSFSSHSSLTSQSHKLKRLWSNRIVDTEYEDWTQLGDDFDDLDEYVDNEMNYLFDN